jgi:hypothetical protein
VSLIDGHKSHWGQQSGQGSCTTARAPAESIADSAAASPVAANNAAIGAAGACVAPRCERLPAQALEGRREEALRRDEQHLRPPRLQVSKRLCGVVPAQARARATTSSTPTAPAPAAVGVPCSK